MTNCADLNQTILSSLHSGDEQSSDDEIKTIHNTSAENADADIDTTLASVRYSPFNVQAVYSELLLIRQRLAQENDRLKKKADLLNQWEERMRQTIEQGWQAHKDKYDGELNGYKEKVNVMTKDLKRTNETLQSLREQNGELKRNLNESREANEKLVEKNKQMEKRMENFIRLNQISEQKIKELEKNLDSNKRIPVPEESIKPTEHQPSKSPSIASADSLIFLFNWLSEIAHTSINEWPFSPPLPSDTLERYSKLLTILIDQSTFGWNKTNSNFTLSYLKLLYFSLITIECPTTNGQTRHLHSCSHRRLCEQILKCEKNQVSSMEYDWINSSGISSKERPHFFDDNEPLIRLYSCLIVLLTCNQIIDLIASYNQLRLDLNSKAFIDLFVTNRGVIALYRWLKPPSPHRRCKYHIRADDKSTFTCLFQWSSIQSIFFYFSVLIQDHFVHF